MTSLSDVAGYLARRQPIVRTGPDFVVIGRAPLPLEVRQAHVRGASCFVIPIGPGPLSQLRSGEALATNYPVFASVASAF